MKPGFDTFTAVFLFIAVLGLLVSLIFFLKFRFKNGAINNTLIVFFFSITLIDWALYWSRYQFHFPHLMFFWLSFCFAYGPLALFYLKELGGEKLSWFQKSLHLSPFAVVFMYNLFFTFSSTSNKQQILVAGFKDFQVHGRMVELLNNLSLIHLVVYACFVLIETRRLKSLNTVKNWSLAYAISFTFFVLNFVVYYFLSKTDFFNKDWDYGIGFSMVLFAISLTLMAYIQPSIFNGYSLIETLGRVDNSKTNQTVNTEKNCSSGEENLNTSVKVSDQTKYKNSALTKDFSRELLFNLHALMHEEKCYLNPNFSLALLSEKLQLSKHHTSQLINEQLGMSFFEYINKLRVEEAANLLTAKKYNYKVIDVAFMVGFNNKVSFYTSFKNLKGMTPVAYAKMNNTQG